MRLILPLLAALAALPAHAAQDAPAPHAEAPVVRAEKSQNMPAEPKPMVAAPQWKMVKEKSVLKFSAIQNGAPVQGRFGDFDAEIRFDPENLDGSSISAVVRTGSVDAANKEVASSVKGAEWLSVEAFPEAELKAEKIQHMPLSDGYYADAALTVRGKTLPVKLNFRMEKMTANYAVATGYITLQRTEFGIGQGEWARDDVVKNEVRVEFRIAAEKI